MFNYAQLNHDNVVIGISQLTGEVDADNMILIEEKLNEANNVQVVIGSVYDRETGKFTAPVNPEPLPVEQKPTLEEMQAKTLLNTEVMIAMKNIGV